MELGGWVQVSLEKILKKSSQNRSIQYTSNDILG